MHRHRPCERRRPVSSILPVTPGTEPPSALEYRLKSYVVFECSSPVWFRRLSNSIVCLAQLFRSAQRREPVITRSSSTIECDPDAFLLRFMTPDRFLVSARVILPVRHLASARVSPPTRLLRFGQGKSSC
ncbi:hypothetical protein V6N12_036102 [Hibiscus sabdariffa]|uniref:Uncharacterized protein n=1 Tax=Hibiscus sabdariffa TaxID=183260 RepID=A0ABR2EPM3_9ROSI